jgi:hypothetical protein
LVSRSTAIADLVSFSVSDFVLAVREQQRQVSLPVRSARSIQNFQCWCLLVSFSCSSIWWCSGWFSLGKDFVFSLVRRRVWTVLFGFGFDSFTHLAGQAAIFRSLGLSSLSSEFSCMRLCFFLSDFPKPRPGFLVHCRRASPDFSCSVAGAIWGFGSSLA